MTTTPREALIEALAKIHADHPYPFVFTKAGTIVDALDAYLDEYIHQPPTLGDSEPPARDSARHFDSAIGGGEAARHEEGDAKRNEGAVEEAVYVLAEFLGEEFFDREEDAQITAADIVRRYELELIDGPAPAKPAPTPEREAEHHSWCHSHQLDLCAGCGVLYGWHRNGVTGEPTTCRNGARHQWPTKPCNCGPNDKRRAERRRTPEPTVLPSVAIGGNAAGTDEPMLVGRETGEGWDVLLENMEHETNEGDSYVPSAVVRGWIDHIRALRSRSTGAAK